MFANRHTALFIYIVDERRRREATKSRGAERACDAATTVAAVATVSIGSSCSPS
jgi:hypothetical protein